MIGQTSQAHGPRSPRFPGHTQQGLCRPPWCRTPRHVRPGRAFDCSSSPRWLQFSRSSRKELNFALIQDPCARANRRTTRDPDRHGPARGDARRFARPQTETPNRAAVQRRQDFSSDRPGDISAFLCHILEANNVKPKRVLRASNLPTHDLQDGDALNALFQAALLFMPETVASDMDASGTDHSLTDSHASDASDD